jgi:hypothetical protein
LVPDFWWKFPRKTWLSKVGEGVGACDGSKNT